MVPQARNKEDAKIIRYRVSDELATFLGRPSGSKMLEKEALGEIEQYIVTKKLHKQKVASLFSILNLLLS